MEGVDDRDREGRHLMCLALLESGISVDDTLPQTRVLPALLREHRRGALEGTGDEIPRGSLRRCSRHTVEECLLEAILPMEEHFALIAEVTEEGAFGQTHRLGRSEERRVGKEGRCRGRRE